MEWAETLHRRQGPAAALPVGGGAARGRPVVAGESRHPHDRAVRGHQRLHLLAPRGGLQEPGHRHPQRQLRGRLVRARAQVRRLRRRSSSRASRPSRWSSRSRTTWSSSCRPRPSTGASRPRRSRQALRADFDPDAKTLSIGPAGENQLPGPASPPTSTTRPVAAATAPSWAARTSRRSPCAAPARSRWATPRPSSTTCTASTASTCSPRTTCGPTKKARRSSSIMNDAGVHPHAQLVRGHLRGDREHQLRRLPEDPHQEPRLLPVRHRLPPVPRGRRRRRRGPGVRDHRPLRRQLRHRRHRGAHEVQPRRATSSAWTPSPPAPWSAWPWT